MRTERHKRASILGRIRAAHWATRPHWRGASGPASEPYDSAAGRRQRWRLGSRGAVPRSGRVWGRLGLGGGVVVPVPIAAATTGLETVGDHTKQRSTDTREDLVQTFGGIATR